MIFDLKEFFYYKLFSSFSLFQCTKLKGKSKFWRWKIFLYNKHSFNLIVVNQLLNRSKDFYPDQYPEKFVQCKI